MRKYPIYWRISTFCSCKIITGKSKVEKIENDEKENLRKYTGSPPCYYRDRNSYFQRRYISTMDLSGFLNEHHTNCLRRFRKCFIPNYRQELAA